MPCNMVVNHLTPVKYCYEQAYCKMRPCAFGHVVIHKGPFGKCLSYTLGNTSKVIYEAVSCSCLAVSPSSIPKTLFQCFQWQIPGIGIYDCFQGGYVDHVPRLMVTIFRWIRCLYRLLHAMSCLHARCVNHVPAFMVTIPLNSMSTACCMPWVAFKQGLWLKVK